MQIEIQEKLISNGNQYFGLACGKKEANIDWSISNGELWLRVCCKNASHKAWKGFGKYFDTFEEAEANYKSAEMKAMIGYVKAQYEKETNVNLH